MKTIYRACFYELSSDFLPAIGRIFTFYRANFTSYRAKIYAPFIPFLQVAQRMDFCTITGHDNGGRKNRMLIKKKRIGATRGGGCVRCERVKKNDRVVAFLFVSARLENGGRCGVWRRCCFLF